MNSTPADDRFASGDLTTLPPMSPDLIGRQEVAQLLKVTTRTVQRYTERPDFPQPVEWLATGRVWRRRDIERWKKRYLPLPQGRPPKTS
jgi:predicted DNA-binding transcriptional regulator AlpA